ncbi:MAG: RNA polymerase sigma factor [Firmicutes bacterium]|nr:RNA polymerase sigma factor [Bacillota bacterium]
MDGRLVAELYDKYREEILLYVYSLCHSIEAAEDITQEVFVKAILSLPEHHENFRAWLYTVARNLTYNHNRKTKNQKKAVEKMKSAPAFEADISEKVVLKERYRELYRAINKLNENYREILILQFFSNMQLREIAGVLGITYGNARVLAHRARSKLKEILEENQT